ncbi:archaellum biogenesis ATPase FlaH [Paenibacillus sp. DS2015]|uniref:TniB family NTP-binding protein n=1 Tax=Paenibacillus sp. DS2015 TaxID=3373917 RepID=UPI003D1C10F2
MDPHKEFAHRVANLFVEHPKMEEAFKAIDNIRNQNRYKIGGAQKSTRCACIIGGSGVGKTQMALRYEEKNTGYLEVIDEVEYDITPVIYVENPDPFTLQGFYKAIAARLGPLPIGRMLVDDAQKLALTRLMKLKVEVVIIDEMDYILTSRAVNEKEAMQAIKGLANKAKLTVILMGTPEVESLFKLNFQNFRRYPKWQLKRFEQCDQTWCDFLQKMEEALSPPQSVGLGEINTGIPQLLFKMSKGLLGILTPVLQEMYTLLGVFENDFNDFSKIPNNQELIPTLTQAYRNINGDLTELEYEEMLLRGY